MRKFVIGILLLLFTAEMIHAQAYEEKIEYDKVKQNSLAMDYTFSPDAVENAVITTLDKLGYKGKEEKGLFNKDKGFRIYKNIEIPDISKSKYDYIFKIEKKSRKAENESVLFMIIQKSGVNAYGILKTDETGNAKKFLVNLLPEIEAAELELQIKAQQELLSHEEKKLKKLKDDRDDMEKRLKKLEEDLKTNAKDQESQQEEIEKQKKLLEELIQKRKGA